MISTNIEPNGLKTHALPPQLLHTLDTYRRAANHLLGGHWGTTPIIVGELCPFFGIPLSPILTGPAITLSSVSVISNALRLRRVRR